jgi:putative membrane protein
MRMAQRTRRRVANPVLGGLIGAVAGIVGSWAMVRFNHLIDPGTGTSDKPRDRHAERRIEARPNDTDGTLPDEPGSMQAASAISERTIGRPLTEREKLIAGPVMHYAFGATMGACYGAAAEIDRSTIRGAGIPFGATVWLVADEIGMHAAGFATHPADYPLSRHAATLASHIVFGLTVEAVRRTLTLAVIGDR